MQPEKTKLIFFIAGFVLMYGIETIKRERPHLASRNRRLLFHISLALINTLFLRLFFSGWLAYFAHYTHQHHWGLLGLLEIDGLPNILLSLIVLDAANYMWHRVNHRLPFLWRFHSVHHSDTEIDVTSSLRFHIGEFVFSHLVKMMWIILWGPTVWAFIIFEIGITMASQFHHSNIRLPDWIESKLRLIIVTPTFHASHHTLDRSTSDYNFSTIFILWDRLFGSFREPRIRREDPMGLPEYRTQTLTFKQTLQQPFR